MPLKNCADCGQVYLSDSNELCEICRERQQKEFERVFAYLQEVKGKASIQEIKAKTGARERTIKYMIQRGWFRYDFQVKYPCEKCGVPITDGKICQDCVDKLRQEMKQIGWGTADYRDAVFEQGSLQRLKINVIRYRGRIK